MIDKSTCLKFYKQKEIQEALVEHAKNKEIGMRHGDSFGKRPDVLNYPRDVMELALQNLTSFHASEEIWSNPLLLSSSLTKAELENLRIGWDLVLDIDCPDWEFSKLTTHLFIKALQDNQVQNISCKFSGNKGFHIGVPFEAFPREIGNKKVKDLFPELPRKISEYLLEYISQKYIQIENEKITFDKNQSYTIHQLKEKFGEKEFLHRKCRECNKNIVTKKNQSTQFVCPKCEQTKQIDAEYLKCEKCHILMEKMENRSSLCPCGSNSSYLHFEPSTIIEIDTILISSRHLYRMPYSLHEKSGLVSLPIKIEQLMNFSKETAKPEHIKTPLLSFLDRSITEESARYLLLKAYEFKVDTKEDKPKKKQNQEYDEFNLTSPIKEEFFPPCIKLMLSGIEDGKKRSIFCLTNYLGKIGWNKEQVEEYIYKWNSEKNHDPLREVYLKGQLQHFKPGERLPPNCDNDGYYKTIGVCQPDAFCRRIKNPANYTILKWKSYLQQKEEEKSKPKRGRKKKEDTDEPMNIAKEGKTEEIRENSATEISSKNNNNHLF